MLQLPQYDLKAGTPKAVKSQAIADLLDQFLGKEESPLDDEVLREVATTEVIREQWVMKFNGTSTANLGGTGMVLYYKREETMALLFKLEFPCSNNIAEYKAYLTRLATAFEMGIKHLNVIGDFNLVICQAKGSFLLKEPSLAPYKMLAQKMEERFSTFKIEHA